MDLLGVIALQVVRHFWILHMFQRWTLSVHCQVYEGRRCQGDKLKDGVVTLVCLSGEVGGTSGGPHFKGKGLEFIYRYTEFEVPIRN